MKILLTISKEWKFQKIWLINMENNDCYCNNFRHNNSNSRKVKLPVSPSQIKPVTKLTQKRMGVVKTLSVM